MRSETDIITQYFFPAWTVGEFRLWKSTANVLKHKCVLRIISDRCLLVKIESMHSCFVRYQLNKDCIRLVVQHTVLQKPLEHLPTIWTRGKFRMYVFGALLFPCRQKSLWIGSSMRVICSLTDYGKLTNCNKRNTQFIKDVFSWKQYCVFFRLNSKWDLRRLCKTVGATALPRLVCKRQQRVFFNGNVLDVGIHLLIFFFSDTTQSRRNGSLWQCLFVRSWGNASCCV